MTRSFNAYPVRPGRQAALLFTLAAFFCLASLGLAGAAEAATANLSWQGSATGNVSGYRVRYGTAIGSYPLQYDAGSATQCVIPNLEAGKTYYFVARGYDPYGNESADSNLVMTGQAGGTVNYVVTAAAGVGGSISPVGSVAVSQGGSKTFAITPNAGFAIADVLLNNSSAGPLSSYTFLNVKANQAIQASFKSVVTTPSSQITDCFLGSWASMGVRYYDFNAKTWTSMTTPATQLATGDVDGDGLDDVLGVWLAGEGIKYWSSLSDAWQVAPNSQNVTAIAAGDLDGEGLPNIIGSWQNRGVEYLDKATGAWRNLTPAPALQIAAADFDGLGKADLVGVWSASEGIKVRLSEGGQWMQLPNSSGVVCIGVGDMDNDGVPDVIGSWAGRGIWYFNMAAYKWVVITSEYAKMVAAGDFDGDGKNDLLGVWPNKSGAIAIYSTTKRWMILSETPDKIAVGRMK